MEKPTVRIFSSIPSAYLESIVQDTLGNVPEIAQYRFDADDPFFAESPIVVIPKSHKEVRDSRSMLAFADRLAASESWHLRHRHVPDENDDLTVYLTTNLVVKSPFSEGVTQYPKNSSELLGLLDDFEDHPFEYAVSFSVTNGYLLTLPCIRFTQAVVRDDGGLLASQIPEDLLQTFSSSIASIHSLEMLTWLQMHQVLYSYVKRFTDPGIVVSRLN
ncbi:MAG: hypothetical protein HGA31_04420 [Candidatus Moranbacteria bacterium]|nr:hypothetical protein [Candidatus Moranbacteria bacterium]